MIARCHFIGRAPLPPGLKAIPDPVRPETGHFTLHCQVRLAACEVDADAVCVGFNFGGHFALLPSLTVDLFGAKHFGASYGWVFTSYGIAGVIGA